MTSESVTTCPTTTLSSHSDNSNLRNLSAWRLTIPNVTAQTDPENPKRQQYFYSVQVRRVDVVEGARIFIALNKYSA